VRFEVRRTARPEEARLLDAQFTTLPLLPTPADLRRQAIELGQACRRIGSTVLSPDLLIAAVALRHKAEPVSFDADFDAIVSVSALRINRPNRPG
jgi:predicted nucleic acid-binding protein